MAKEKICGIYCIKNTVNNKVYIGQSNNIEKRFYEHKRTLVNNNHRNIYLQRAWNKYGKDNFMFNIVEKYTELELNDKEVYYIKKFKSDNLEFGYNLTSGGENYKRSEETCLKISDSLKGRKMSLEQKEKISIKDLTEK